MFRRMRVCVKDDNGAMNDVVALFILQSIANVSLFSHSSSDSLPIGPESILGNKVTFSQLRLKVDGATMKKQIVQNRAEDKMALKRNASPEM